MNPLVSVIIPTKNSARTIAACIASVKKQSYPAIECIVVDNYSTDATRDIATSQSAIVLVAGDERSQQRNKGADAARGQYLCFIDSDMELAEDVIAECVETALQDNLVALSIPEESFGTTFWARCKRFERSCYIDVPWMQGVRFFTSKSFRRIHGYDTSMIAGEDFDIHNRIVDIYGKHSVGSITTMIYHNEGALSLYKTIQKKYYYGRFIHRYLTKAHNTPMFQQQSSIYRRLIIFIQHGNLIAQHPLLFLGTCYMKVVEFAAGGIGYVAGYYQHNTIELIRSSLFLDWMMVRKVHMSGLLNFLLRKYSLLAAPSLHKNHSKNAYIITAFGRQLFLPTPNDISAIQSNFIAHTYLQYYIPKNATIIDIGAHIGQFNIFCKIYLHAQSVFSFEPIQSSYHILSLNAPTNVYHAAVSNKKDILMHVPACTQLATVFPEAYTHHREEEKVSCVAIDDVAEIQQLEHIDLLKIDVEGMEHEVLETCVKTLQKTRYLLVEVSLQREQSTSSLKTLSYIHQLLPQAELLHVGNIYPNSNSRKQEAVDMLFRITRTSRDRL